MTTGIAPARGDFDYDADLEFLKEFGDLLKNHPHLSLQVQSLIERILINPYEPSLIRACTWVNAKNNLFEYAIGKVALNWQVSPKRTESILNTDWRVRFLKISI
jgi:hypothetical protein